MVGKGRGKQHIGGIDNGVDSGIGVGGAIGDLLFGFLDDGFIDDGDRRGGSCVEGVWSSSVLRMEESIWNVAFSKWVKWLVMAMTVRIRTKKTKREKKRLLMSLMMFWVWFCCWYR